MECRLPSKYTALPEEECIEYEGGKLSGGAIAGIIIGCAIVAGCCIYGGVKLYKNYQIKNYNIWEHIETYENNDVVGACVDWNYKSAAHMNELKSVFGNGCVFRSSNGSKIVIWDPTR